MNNPENFKEFLKNLKICKEYFKSKWNEKKCQENSYIYINNRKRLPIQIFSCCYGEIFWKEINFFKLKISSFNDLSCFINNE